MLLGVAPARLGERFSDLLGHDPDDLLLAPPAFADDGVALDVAHIAAQLHLPIGQKLNSQPPTSLPSITVSEGRRATLKDFCSPVLLSVYFMFSWTNDLCSVM